MAIAAFGSAGIMISGAGPAVAGCDVNLSAPGVDCTFDAPPRTATLVIPPTPPVPPPIPPLPPNPLAGCTVWVTTPGVYGLAIGTSGIALGGLTPGGANASC